MEAPRRLRRSHDDDRVASATRRNRPHSLTHELLEVRAEELSGLLRLDALGPQAPGVSLGMIGGLPMPPDPSIEQRLSAVEAAVAEIRDQLAGAIPAPNWVERFTGTFKDEPAFAEVVAYGRAFRSADRPREDAEP